MHLTYLDLYPFSSVYISKSNYGVYLILVYYFFDPGFLLHNMLISNVTANSYLSTIQQVGDTSKELLKVSSGSYFDLLLHISPFSVLLLSLLKYISIMTTLGYFASELRSSSVLQFLIKSAFATLCAIWSSIPSNTSICCFKTAFTCGGYVLKRRLPVYCGRCTAHIQIFYT